MSTTLDAIRSRAEAYRDHGTPGLHAPQDRASLLAALEACLVIHQPLDAVMYTGAKQRMVEVCTGCGTDDGNWQRYPCPTVRVIDSAVGGAS